MKFEDFLTQNGYKNVNQMNGSSLVFQANLKGKDYIIKTDDANDLQGNYLLSMEKEILQKSTDLKGVSRLEKIWHIDNPNYINFALIKNYVPGLSLEHNVRVNTSTEKDIIEIIKGLHNLGYCSFDIRPRNFVIDEKRKPYFIDIPDQYTKRKKEISNQEWSSETEDDIKEVKYMMRNLK